MMTKLLATRRKSLTFALFLLVLLGIGWLGVTGRKDGARSPYTPSTADMVIAHVPSTRHDPQSQHHEASRATLTRTPTDLALATEVARMDIAAARQGADPRYLGYAQAALAPFWQAPHPPRQVRVLRATIRQARHDFEGALVDLGEALAMDPQDPQARLIQATVFTVLGRFPEALASCERLFQLAGPTLSIPCEAPILARTGKAELATSRLEHLLASSPQNSLAGWAHSILGEIGYWQGDKPTAERHLLESLKLDPSDRYTRATYADFLLDEGRPKDVIPLLSAYPEDDTLLLRLAIAHCQLGGSRGTEQIRILAERLAANHLREDHSHQREEARFALRLNNEPARALDLALANFAKQREPWDVRLVFEAALAAKNTVAAQPVVRWLLETGSLTPRLRSLAGQIAKNS